MLQPTHELTNEEYHAHPAVSRSGLALIAHSPLHVWHRYHSGTYTPPVPAPALRLGTAVHMAVLEPDLFADSYAEAPSLSRTTKAGKEAWAAAAEGGQDLLTADELAQINGMCTALQQHPAARQALNVPGINEASYITTDPGTGIGIKCRPDRLTESGWVVDLKTTRDASAAAFAKSTANFGYHVQAAFYMHCLDVLGERPKGFIIVAVEKDPPYAVQVFRIAPAAVQLGTREMFTALGTLQRCRLDYPLDQPWPAYNNEVVDLELPAWAMRDS